MNIEKMTTTLQEAIAEAQKSCGDTSTSRN